MIFGQFCPPQGVQKSQKNAKNAKVPATINTVRARPRIHNHARILVRVFVREHVGISHRYRCCGAEPERLQARRADRLRRLALLPCEGRPRVERGA